MKKPPTDWIFRTHLLHTLKQNEADVLLERAAQYDKVQKWYLL